ncbi:MAG TPA: hypothetical protein VKV73_21110 [Chloroflexota bacterium]|nr:hypothetical protein [Chloroflexota bacterium]
MVRQFKSAGPVSRVVASAAISLVVATALLMPLSASRAQALSAALPSHFSFGLQASPADAWLTNSGIAWDFTYQYLAGGVNTNSGWETWNAGGQFPLYYAQNAASKGRIPMFPYYELLQSSGSCGSCGENQRDITNLNTPALMLAYYQNFALLMKRLGPGTYDGIQGFGKPALINVEPDMSGGYAMQAVNNNGVCFGFCTGQGNNPGLLKAAVATTGYADVVGYADTYAGFTQALAHLRDLYAPNVLLGPNISSWATGDDIGTDSNPATNGAALGQQVGTFLSQTGAHDVLFDDPLDRDAGQYKALFGQNRWWDRLNVKFPNFQRWEQYVKATSVADGGKSALLWQVPIGNQYFDTVNNTNGHYQDNRAEYIFGHVPELIQSGIVGAMFGAGNSGNTVESDATGDGITNPASFCTTDGVSSGQVCNTQVSTVADDDGGYIRMQGLAYYKNPVPLSGSPPTSTPTLSTTGTPTATPTSTPAVTATATPTSNASYATSASASPGSVTRGGMLSVAASLTSSATSSGLVDIEIFDPSGAKVFQQDWDNQAFTPGVARLYASTWQVPSGATLGNYRVSVAVFKPGWGPLVIWNGSAAAFSVVATSTATPTNTAVPTATNTAVPTATPTRTSVPTATPPPPPYTSSASVSPGNVPAGSTLSINASVKSTTASTVGIAIMVKDPSGALVSHTLWNSESFTAGQTKPYSAQWTVPASAPKGPYTVTVGVASVGWGIWYSWNGNAGTFTVQ